MKITKPSNAIKGSTTLKYSKQQISKIGSQQFTKSLTSKLNISIALAVMVFEVGCNVQKVFKGEMSWKAFGQEFGYIFASTATGFVGGAAGTGLGAMVGGALFGTAGAVVGGIFGGVVGGVSAGVGTDLVLRKTNAFGNQADID